jgi:hypothetical protein
MNVNVNEVAINGEIYVKKSDISTTCPVNVDGLKYQIVRTYSAGVFAGYVQSRNGQEVVMLNARRIYYWAGAATLSELAQRGTSNPDNCKFPIAVARVELFQVIEILDCTEVAKKSIEGVKIWTK